MVISATIHFRGCTASGIPVKALTDDQYLVEDLPDPFTEHYNHLDVIRLKRESDGSYTFRGVVTPSGWHRHRYMLPRRENLLELLEPVFRHVQAVGGAAMLDFGGCLQVFLPPECSWDPSDAVEAAA